MGCIISRVYAPVDDITLEQIDQAAKEKGIIMAQGASSAIESVLHQGGDGIENLCVNCSRPAPKGRRLGEKRCN